MQYGPFESPGGAVYVYSLSVILFTQKSVERHGNPTKLFDKMNLNTPVSDSSDFCKDQDYAWQGEGCNKSLLKAIFAPAGHEEIPGNAVFPGILVVATGLEPVTPSM